MEEPTYLDLGLLSPTDCVKDRLAAFYHWKDQQSLEPAIQRGSVQKVLSLNRGH